MCAGNAEAFPDKTAIVWRETELSFSQLEELCCRCASGLSRLGLGPGDKLALLLEKTPALVICFIACAKIGAIVVPLNYQLKPEALRRIIVDYQIDGLVVSGKFLGLLGGVGRDHKAMRRLVVCDVSAEQAGGQKTWEELVEEGDSEFEPARVDDDAPFYFNFTSGTTGAPKAAVTTHSNLFWNTISSVETLGLRHTDVHLCMFPAYLHPHETFIRGLYLGGTTVLESSLFPKSVARAITDNKVTCMMGAATLYERLLPFAENEQFDYSSLRIAESGGMVTRETLIKEFESSFGIPITPVWGSTETTGIAIAPHSGEVRRGGSIGKAALHYDVRVVRDDGSYAAPMELGEMLVSGKGVVSEYYEAPEETSCFFEDGWFRTGDLVKMDEDGFVYFVDRKDSMMKVSGMKVFPSAIERVLREHPAVEDACVVAVDDQLRGQVPKAVVVRRPGTTVEPEELRRHCASRLAAYEVPKLFEFREDIPRTGMGKILKSALRELASEAGIHANIADLRAQIDRIDVQIVKLLNERARSVASIRQQVEAKGEKMFSAARDEEVLRNVLGHNPGPAHDETIEEIFRSILSAFKKM